MLKHIKNYLSKIVKIAGYMPTIFLFAVSPSAVSQEMPNILWITIEDTSPNFLGCYGNSEVSTPTIDSLASRGIRFTNAFSTGTVCSPSRSTLITGVKTYELGTGDHRRMVPFPEKIKGFPYYLREVGYYTSNNAKEDYNVADKEQFSATAWHESSNKAGWWNRVADQPFFSVFNFDATHQSRTMTWPYAKYEEEILGELVRLDDTAAVSNNFSMPPFFRDSPEMRKEHRRVYGGLKLVDLRIKGILNRLRKDSLLDNTIIFFFSDHGQGIPRGKMNGISFGYKVPLIINFPEKWKHLIPEQFKDGLAEELVSFEDFAPTLLSLTGASLPDYMKGRVLFGSSRSKPVPYLYLSNDRSDNGPDVVRSVTDGTFIYSKNFTPYTPELRYIRYISVSPIFNLMKEDHTNNVLNSAQSMLFKERPTEYLFNIDRDPWEIKNLSATSEYSDKLEHLRTTLRKHLHKARDVMLLPEYERSLLSKKTTPYSYRQDSSAFSVRKVLNAAFLSGVRDSITVSRQVELLQSEDKFVRYWAIIGLRSQPTEALLKYRDDLIRSSQDTYPPVAIISAALVYEAFDHNDSRKLLNRYLNSDNVDLLLLTISQLMYVTQKSPFVTEMLQVVERERTKFEVLKNGEYFAISAALDFLGSLEEVPNTYDYRR